MPHMPAVAAVVLGRTDGPRQPGCCRLWLQLLLLSLAAPLARNDLEEFTGLAVSQTWMNKRALSDHRQHSGARWRRAEWLQ